MGKLRSITKLPLIDHVAFVEAAVMMGWARTMVAFVPMRHWHQEVGTGEAAAANPSDEAAIASVARAIRRVGRNSPVHFVCLPQALAARWMLHRRGIGSNLFIGTHNMQARKKRINFMRG